MASLSVGIVGLPNVGKSTLFNALTDNNALAANYPFATIEPNTGMAPVPDERLAKLSELYDGAPIKPATVNFVDIAGLVAGASHGEGLGNQFLSHIRSCDAICQVVRAFTDSAVLQSGNSDPKQNLEIINTELILADLQTIERRLPRLAKEVKADPKLKPMMAILEKVRATLDTGKLAGTVLNPEEKAAIRDLQLLTAKPFIFVFNLGEDQLNDIELKNNLSRLAGSCPSLFLSAKLEDELKSLDSEDARELLSSYGQASSGLSQIAQAGYAALNLQSFLTAGHKEVRAWTIKRGATAPQAAGTIHGDFERGFIAAEIINYSDLITTGSLSIARSKGLIRTEGKNYIMQPDDIVEFRFNVSK